jgi:hypothetical protein
MKSHEAVQQEFHRCVHLFDKYYFLHGKDKPQTNSQFPSEFHPGVDLWLAGVEGLQRTLEWTLGRVVFYEAFYLLTFEYLARMRLDGWVGEWAWLPHDSPLPFEHQEVPHYQLRSSSDLGMVLERAVAVQNRVMTVELMHPGKWHPMFHGRVKKWLVNVENIIRVTEWVLEKRSTENALYLVEGKSLEQLDSARRGGVVPYSSGALRQIHTMLGMDIGNEDHKPEDFQ